MNEKVWRVVARYTEPKTIRDIWSDIMQPLACAAVGYARVGELGRDESDESLIQRIAHAYPDLASRKSFVRKEAHELLRFRNEVAIGDIVVAAWGETALGVGRVTGEYTFVKSDADGAPNRRATKWRETDTKVPGLGLAKTTIAEITDPSTIARLKNLAPWP